MKILYIGDVMGRPGRKILAKTLPGLRIQHDIDVVIAQAENVSHGKGMSNKHYNELEEQGVNGFSGGNHSFEREDTLKLVASPTSPVIAPANVKGAYYKNFKIIESSSGNVAIVSLLGYTIPKGYADNVENPLHTIDTLLPELKKLSAKAIVVNIHGDVSSEKVMMGHYLDGKVTAVIGDHWHIPTADARILPNGTAHVTDVGMCGTLNSSLGVDIKKAIRRWQGEVVKNSIEYDGPLQFNAVLITTDEKSLLAKEIQRIQVYL